MRNSDLAYDRGSPKRSDYTERVCALCQGHNGHYEDCSEVRS